MKRTGIVLFVYNRPYHTKEVLKGLKKNNISNFYITGVEGDQEGIRVTLM